MFDNPIIYVLCLPRMSQEDGLGKSSSVTLSGSWHSPYHPPQPGNQDCKYWIIPELPLLGMDVVDSHVWGSVLGSRTYWDREDFQHLPLTNQIIQGLGRAARGFERTELDDKSTVANFKKFLAPQRISIIDRYMKKKSLYIADMTPIKSNSV